MLKYLSVRPKGHGSLFVFQDSVSGTSSYFYYILNKSLRAIHLVPHAYKAHSFRIGAATTAAALGYSDTQISAMGRWHSQAFKNIYVFLCYRLKLISGGDAMFCMACGRVVPHLDVNMLVMAVFPKWRRLQELYLVRRH